MPSLDERIKYAAKRAEERRVQQRRYEHDELRELVADEVTNTRKRALNDIRGQFANTPDRDRLLIKTLHGKTLDETYTDYDVETSPIRVRDRIEKLLLLCAGDERLLLDEYARELNARLPLAQVAPTFEWRPRLVKVPLGNGKTRRTILFSWRRLRPILSNPTEREEEGE